MGKVRKGDCIVTFKRSSIFAIKKEVERKTGMRCAVVYGRLPPEIRSKQAALLNDPEIGYDVMVGSDAIGMGLNLCVRRLCPFFVNSMRCQENPSYHIRIPHKILRGGLPTPLNIPTQTNSRPAVRTTSVFYLSLSRTMRLRNNPPRPERRRDGYGDSRVRWGAQHDRIVADNRTK